ANHLLLPRRTAGEEKPVDPQKHRKRQRRLFEEEGGKVSQSGDGVSAPRTVGSFLGAKEKQEPQDSEARGSRVRQGGNPRDGLHVLRMQGPKQGAAPCRQVVTNQFAPEQ